MSTSVQKIQLPKDNGAELAIIFRVRRTTEDYLAAKAEKALHDQKKEEMIAQMRFLKETDVDAVTEMAKAYGVQRSEFVRYLRMVKGLTAALGQ